MSNGSDPAKISAQKGSAQGIYLEGADQRPYLADSVSGQSTNASCASAACKKAGKLNVPESFIRSQMAENAANRGTPVSIAAIPETLKDFGFKGSATYVSQGATVKSIDLATKNGNSAIVSVWTGSDNSHAIVVDKIVGGRAFIRDPSPVGRGSSYTISVADLQKSISGRAVYLFSEQ